MDIVVCNDDQLQLFVTRQIEEQRWSDLPEMNVWSQILNWQKIYWYTGYSLLGNHQYFHTLFKTIITAKQITHGLLFTHVQGFWYIDTEYGRFHYSDILMSAMASQITSLTIVYSIVYSGADQRKYQCSASLAFVRGNPRTIGQ